MKREQGIKKVSDNILMLSDYVSPKIIDIKSQNYVLWGENNCFYDYLRDIYLNSTTNNACINGVVKLAYGDGLFFDDPRKTLSMENVVSANELRRLFLQMYTYNKFVAQVEYHMTDDGVRDIEKGIRKVFFIPAKDVAPSRKNEEDEIHTYYISKDWSQTRKAEYKPKPVPAFGFGAEEDEVEIYFWQLEIDNDEYFAPVTYQGCLQYAECEVETSNYHLNHILRGFAPSGIINFNNGVPEADIRKKITRDFVASKTGSENAGKAFITFNDSADNAVTIASYDIPDPHRQYEFIASISEKKILLGHNISSPLLFGIRDTTGGLGNNANEIRDAYEIMREMTLEPVRQAFLQGMEPLLLEMGIPQKPKFSDLAIFTEPVIENEEDAGVLNSVQSLSPLVANKVLESMVPNEIRNLVGLPKVEGGDVKPVTEAMPAEFKRHYHSDSEGEPEGYAETWMKALEGKGETIGDEWQEVSATAVENPEMEDDIVSLMMNTTPPDGEPEDKSVGDSGLFKVRYRYGPMELKPNSRDLCVYLVDRAKTGVVYRKEDIDSWEDEGVNSQFAPKGKSKYSLWLWKGGVYCHHRWFRVIYFRKRNADGTFMKPSQTPLMENDRKVSQPQARKQGLPEDKLNPAGWPDAGTAPIDQPNRGSLKNR